MGKNMTKLIEIMDGERRSNSLTLSLSLSLSLSLFSFFKPES